MLLLLRRLKALSNIINSHILPPITSLIRLTSLLPTRAIRVFPPARRAAVELHGMEASIPRSQPGIGARRPQLKVHNHRRCRLPVLLECRPRHHLMHPHPRHRVHRAALPRRTHLMHPPAIPVHIQVIRQADFPPRYRRGTLVR